MAKVVIITALLVAETDNVSNTGLEKEILREVSKPGTIPYVRRIEKVTVLGKAVKSRLRRLRIYPRGVIPT